MTDLHQHESEFSRLIEQLPCDDAPRPQSQAESLEQALARFDQAVESQSELSITVVPPWKQTLIFWRNMMRRPVPRLIATSVACLAIAAIWLFAPGHQTKAFGFNNFAAALVEAKTAKFRMEVKIEGIPGQSSTGYYLAPEKFRLEMQTLAGEMISISDDKTGKSVMLTPSNKTAMVMNSKGKPKDQTPNNPFVRIKDLLSQDRDQKENPFKPVGEKEIDGKRATGFQSETTIGRCTLWGDPVTGHPLRVEMIWSGTPRNETIMSNFEINVDLQESLFDQNPPADYKVQSFDIDLSKPVESDLVAAFKACGELSGGEFPDSLSLLGQTSFSAKHIASLFKDKAAPTNDEMQTIIKRLEPITRGFRFALELPESADAWYAGKGVKQGTANAPIFWYKPAGSPKYRVLQADLTMSDADTAPKVTGAERLGKVNEPPK